MKNIAYPICILLVALSILSCSNENGTRSLEETGKQADEAFSTTADTLNELSQDVKKSFDENAEIISKATSKAVKTTKEWTSEQLDTAGEAKEKVANGIDKKTMADGEAVKKNSQEK